MTKKKHPRHFENEAAREAYARAWLIYLGVDPAPERIQEIVPFVDDHEPRSPLAHIANHLIIQGKLPTRKAVNHEQ